MTNNTPQTEKDTSQGDQRTEQPVALLYFTDLMFGVQLQTIARHAGYKPVNVRLNSELPAGNLLIVDIAARGDWDALIRKARHANLPVIAFGPHVDVEARKRAKSAGASRLLANSNLGERLPGILLALRDADVERISPGEIVDEDE